MIQSGCALAGLVRACGQALRALLQGFRALSCLGCARIQRRGGIRQGRGLALQLAQTLVQGFQIVVHLGRACGQAVAAGLGLGRALGQLGRAVVQRAHALGQCRGRSTQLVHAVLQLLCAVVQLLRAVRQLLHALGVLGKALGQGLAAAAEGKGAVRQKLQILPDGIVAVRQLVCALPDLARAVRRLLHAVAHLGELVKHGLGVGLGHLFPHAGLNFLHGGLAQLGGDVVGAGVGLVVQLHLFGLIVGEGGRVGREVFGDGDYHIVIPCRQPLGRVLLAHLVEVQGGVLQQAVHQFGAHIQGLALVFHRLVLIHQSHRQVFHAAVGVPHGAQKQSGVDGGNGNNGHHNHQHQLVAQQLFPFIFQHRTKKSLPFLDLSQKINTMLFIHRSIAFSCKENYTKLRRTTQPTVSVAVSINRHCVVLC